MLCFLNEEASNWKLPFFMACPEYTAADGMKVSGIYYH
jgi:hypothetical protein